MFQLKKINGRYHIRRVPDTDMGNPEKESPFAFEITYEEFGKRYCFNKTKKMVPTVLEETIKRL